MAGLEERDGAGAKPPSAEALCLCQRPTPVFRVTSLPLGRGELWIKNDGVIHPRYGGNKVRKLERILAEARRRGSRRLVTLGAAGSHHALATCVFGRELGLPTAAVLTRQPWSHNAEQTLRASLACGLEAYAAPSAALVPVRLARLLRAGDMFIPVGGSSITGALGYVDAVAELASQIRAGDVPEPDLIVSALGSGGTVAGLVAGVAREGLGARVLGVSVAARRVGARALVLPLAWASARRVSAPKSVSWSALSRSLLVDATELGRGYGHPTERGDAATRLAQEIGLALEPTYTAKAFAGALARLGCPALPPAPNAKPEPAEITQTGPRGRPFRVLYWHTYSAAPLHPLLKSAHTGRELPSRLCALLDSR